MKSFSIPSAYSNILSELFYLVITPGGTQFQPKSKKVRIASTQQLDTELWPNVYSIAFEEHQAKKKEYIEHTLYIRLG